MHLVIKPKDHTDNDFFITSYPHDRDGILVNMDVPPEVERAVSLVQDFFKINPLPVASLDFGGHGAAGLIFTENRGKTRGEDMNTDFNINGLRARISFGPSSENREDITQTGWNPKYMGRFHIGVQGGRRFFPTEYNSFDDSDWGQVRKNLAVITEEIHFSWRFEDGKFDDWNCFADWYNDKGTYNGHSFHKIRTSHLTSKVDFDSENKSNSLAEHLEHLGRKPQAFPLDVSFADYTKAPQEYSPSDLLEMWRRNHSEGSFPIVGYAPTLEVLSKFDNSLRPSDTERIPHFNPSEAVEYLFGKVLPAVDKFVNS